MGGTIPNLLYFCLVDLFLNLICKRTYGVNLSAGCWNIVILSPIANSLSA